MESLRRHAALIAAAMASGVGGLTGAIRSFEGFAKDLVKADPPVPKRKRKAYWSPKNRTNHSTYFGPEKRNGERECARRRRQMAAGTHGYSKAVGL